MKHIPNHITEKYPLDTYKNNNILKNHVSSVSKLLLTGYM